MDVLNPIYNNLSNLKDSFFSAKPFPYIVLDDFLDPLYFSELSKVLNGNSRPELGKSFETDVEFNKAISLNSNLPELVSNIVTKLNSQIWLNNLKDLTGINTLVSTNNGNTLLANYHEMTQGGLLGSHVDHSFEPELGLPHVLNIVIYLSSDWDPNFGGGTLLYNRTGSKVIAKIDYRPNRAIIFLHTPYSFHGVDRLKNNGSIVRKTLYVDYYSESFDPFKEMKFDFPNIWFKHATTFRLPRFLDYFKSKNSYYARTFYQYWKDERKNRKKN